MSIYKDYNFILFFYRTEIKYMFLVGGFAESPILQHEMRSEFGNIMKILIPQEVSLAILKGTQINITSKIFVKQFINEVHLSACELIVCGQHHA